MRRGVGRKGKRVIRIPCVTERFAGRNWAYLSRSMRERGREGARESERERGTGGWKSEELQGLCGENGRKLGQEANRVWKWSVG